jgi:hypothetical protein
MADPTETTRISTGPAAGDEPGALLEGIRELSQAVADLQAEVQALRAESRALPSGGDDRHGWDDRSTGSRDPLAWVHAVESPRVRQRPVPQLLLEIVFLIAVAVAAVIAELGTAGIVAIMAGAWALVALAEWAAAREARQRAEAIYMPLPAPGRGFGTDPSWFAPPVERTVLDVEEVGEDTAARLPPSTTP